MPEEMMPEKAAAIEARIKKEFQQLRKLLPKIGKDRKGLAEKLMKRAAFIKITLEDLEADISRNGCVSEYQNGENQWGTKKSPEVEIYNTMIKNYSAVIKQISDMLPAEVESAGVKDDGLDEFINSR